MNSTSRTLVALVFAAGTVTTALAAELPAYYPKTFDSTGVINTLPNPNNHSVVIDDRRIAVSPGLVVHSPLVRSGGATLLKVGQSVGYTVTGSGSVSEVWVFPAGYISDGK